MGPSIRAAIAGTAWRAMLGVASVALVAPVVVVASTAGPSFATPAGQSCPVPARATMAAIQADVRPGQVVGVVGSTWAADSTVTVQVDSRDYDKADFSAQADATGSWTLRVRADSRAPSLMQFSVSCGATVHIVDVKVDANARATSSDASATAAAAPNSSAAGGSAKTTTVSSKVILVVILALVLVLAAERNQRRRRNSSS